MLTESILNAMLKSLLQQGEVSQKLIPPESKRVGQGIEKEQSREVSQGR